MMMILFVGVTVGHSQAEAAETSPIRVMLNEETTPLSFTVDPISRQGTTLVQMRPLFERLGMELTWNQAAGTVKAVKSGTELTLKLGSKTATVNGKNVTLDYPATSINGNTLVPLRFVGEATGAIVHWNGAGRQILVVTTEWMQENNVTPAQVKAELAKLQADANAKHAEAKAAEKADSSSANTTPVNVSKLSGMYYGAEYDYAGYECGGICWKFYTFLPNNKIVVGEPVGGGPENVNCSKDQCRTYSVSGGQLKIQGGETLPISISKEGRLVIDEVHLDPVKPAAAGTKLNGEYISQGYYGLVGITPFSTSWTDYLTFYSDGRFTSDTLTIAALDTGAARTDSSSSAKTLSGTYTISKNTITLKYSDGKTESYIFDKLPPDKEGVIYVQIGGRSFHLK
ncbi:copper amine oxidase N-terminal domain-containing protein [Saccharibacillus sacchari]|uniref:copper amine oxidase N-terminal domain-containing protein n=1 Tax=Saccharibacillus sacchari TaxID=456493 RepID=UPI0004BB1F44|nr:copper amine oxidase N-terminal domain-containing protein [Saccharibacillus sacchari]